MSMQDENTKLVDEQVFTGSIYQFYAFDIGDDVHLEKIKNSKNVTIKQRPLSDYLKTYHKPLTIDIKSVSDKAECIYANIHHFGVISFVYHVPFKGTLTELRDKLNNMYEELQRDSVQDAKVIFEVIKHAVTQPVFYHLRNKYFVAQINPEPTMIDTAVLRDKFGGTIASALRFEKTNISTFQLEDILESATGYYRNDLVIIDTEAAFVYDKDPQELLDFFEISMVQQLELRYFDKLLDGKLDAIYSRTLKKPSLIAYMPFIGTTYDPISELSKLRVDISVITERLENSIKTVGEAYYSEIYNLLVEKLEIELWKKSIEKKLSIVHEVRTIYQTQVSSIRHDMMNVLIIILIFIETVVALIELR